MENNVQNIDWLFWGILGFSVVMLTAITVTMIVFVVKYRQSVHPKASDIRGNWKVELIWTLIPTVIALFMFYFGWTSYMGSRTVPPNALPIDVVGVQYAWIFTYPNHKESEGLLMVPEKTPILLNITSDDVLHSLSIPAFRIKRDAVSGIKTYTWFYADKPGTYDIFCAEYCGLGHA
ncbi:MAG: cytochrome c oxidase subunit II, partial [Planctomycetota bacterium]